MSGLCIIANRTHFFACATPQPLALTWTFAEHSKADRHRNSAGTCTTDTCVHRPIINPAINSKMGKESPAKTHRQLLLKCCSLPSFIVSISTFHCGWMSFRYNSANRGSLGTQPVGICLRGWSFVRISVVQKLTARQTLFTDICPRSAKSLT